MLLFIMQQVSFSRPERRSNLSHLTIIYNVSIVAIGKARYQNWPALGSQPPPSSTPSRRRRVPWAVRRSTLPHTPITPICTTTTTITTTPANRRRRTRMRRLGTIRTAAVGTARTRTIGMTSSSTIQTGEISPIRNGEREGGGGFPPWVFCPLL